MNREIYGKNYNDFNFEMTDLRMQYHTGMYSQSYATIKINDREFRIEYNGYEFLLIPYDSVDCFTFTDVAKMYDYIKKDKYYA